MIKVDSTSNSGAQTVLNYNYNHTVGAGNNTILIVGTGLREGGANVSSVTFNGEALTQINSIGTDLESRLWYLINPDTGTHSVAVSTTGGSVPAPAGSFAISLFGVNLTDPIDNSATDGGDLNGSVTSTLTGALIIDCLYGGGTGLTENGSQTKICEIITAGEGGDTFAGSYKLGTKPGSYSMIWTGADISGFQCLIALKPANQGSALLFFP